MSIRTAGISIRIGQAMRQQLVHLINAALLIVVFIGFPAITGRNFGSLRLSDHSILHQLTVGGLMVGLLLNISMAVFLVQARKERWLCVKWSLLFGLLLAAVLAHAAGSLSFRWLRDWLLWGRSLL